MEVWREREVEEGIDRQRERETAGWGLWRCIMHRGSSARVACFMGWCQGCHSCFTLCGAGPVAMAAAKQLISKYYPWPADREQGADFNGQQTSNNRFTIDGGRGEGRRGADVWKTLAEWGRGIRHVHMKWFEFILCSLRSSALHL